MSITYNSSTTHTATIHFDWQAYIDISHQSNSPEEMMTAWMSRVDALVMEQSRFRNAYPRAYIRVSRVLDNNQGAVTITYTDFGDYNLVMLAAEEFCKAMSQYDWWKTV